MVLSQLRLPVDGPPENRAAVVELPGWEEWFLELLLEPGQRLWRRHSRTQPPGEHKRSASTDSSASLSGRQAPHIAMSCCSVQSSQCLGVFEHGVVSMLGVTNEFSHE